MYSLKKTLSDLDKEFKMSVDYDHELMKRQIEEARILRSKETVRLIKLTASFIGMPFKLLLKWIKAEIKSHQTNNSLFETTGKNLHPSAK